MRFHGFNRVHVQQGVRVICKPRPSLDRSLLVIHVESGPTGQDLPGARTSAGGSHSATANERTGMMNNETRFLPWQ